MEGLQVDRIDPKAETERISARSWPSRAKDLDEAGRALLREDLRLPCTEEVAVFHAFSRIVAEARSSFVVLDTAPTGHTLLLMDATGAYHRQMTRKIVPQRTKPRRDATHATAGPGLFQDRPGRAARDHPGIGGGRAAGGLAPGQIEPYAWVINRSLLGSGTRDPLLSARLVGEQEQIARIGSGLARRTYLLPWQAEPPVGLTALEKLVS